MFQVLLLIPARLLSQPKLLRPSLYLARAGTGRDPCTSKSMHSPFIVPLPLSPSLSTHIVRVHRQGRAVVPPAGSLPLPQRLELLVVLQGGKGEGRYRNRWPQGRQGVCGPVLLARGPGHVRRPKLLTALSPSLKMGSVSNGCPASRHSTQPAAAMPKAAGVVPSTGMVRTRKLGTTCGDIMSCSCQVLKRHGS